LLLRIGRRLRLSGLLWLPGSTAALRRPTELTSLSRREPLLLRIRRCRRLSALLRLSRSAAALRRPAELTELPRRQPLLLGGGRLWLPALLSLSGPAAPLRLAELPRHALRPPSLLRRLTDLSRCALWWRALRARLRPSRLRALRRRTFLQRLSTFGRRLLALLPWVVLIGAGLRQHDDVRSHGPIVGQARTRECNRRQHRAGEQSVAEILVHFGPCKIRIRRPAHVMDHRPEVCSVSLHWGRSLLRCSRGN
jgi:hypothetical protein